eukprot:scaffold35019_cov52-Phaeocystis_antarctica.AAC.2
MNAVEASVTSCDAAASLRTILSSVAILTLAAALRAAAADCHSRTAWTYSSVSAPDRYELTESGLAGGPAPSCIVARLVRAALTRGAEPR